MNRINKIYEMDQLEQAKIASKAEENIGEEDDEIETEQEEKLEHSLLEKFLLLNLEKCSSKELAHIVACRKALSINFDSIITSYNEEMAVQMQVLAPNEPPGSWCAILSDDQRLPNSWLNDPSKTTSPTMLQIFHELGQVVDVKYSEMAEKYSKIFPDFDFEKFTGSLTRARVPPTPQTPTISFLKTVNMSQTQQRQLRQLKQW